MASIVRLTVGAVHDAVPVLWFLLRTLHAQFVDVNGNYVQKVGTNIYANFLCK